MKPEICRIEQNKVRRERQDLLGRVYHDRILLQGMDTHRHTEWRHNRITPTEYFRQAAAAGEFAAQLVRMRTKAATL